MLSQILEFRLFFHKLRVPLEAHLVSHLAGRGLGGLHY